MRFGFSLAFKMGRLQQSGYRRKKKLEISKNRRLERDHEIFGDKDVKTLREQRSSRNLSCLNHFDASSLFSRSLAHGFGDFGGQ